MQLSNIKLINGWVCREKIAKQKIKIYQNENITTKPLANGTLTPISCKIYSVRKIKRQFVCNTVRHTCGYGMQGLRQVLRHYDYSKIYKTHNFSLICRQFAIYVNACKIAGQWQQITVDR